MQPKAAGGPNTVMENALIMFSDFEMSIAQKIQSGSGITPT
jgi:hypothetical protein